MGNKRVPEIRSGEFSGEWEKIKLGNLYNVYSGQTPLRSDASNFDNPNTPWVKTTDLNNSTITVNEENISEKAAKKLKVLKSNTVLIAMYGGFNQIGRTGILTYPATINQAISALEPIDNVVPYFLLTELNFRVREWQRLAASSRKDPNITKRDVESFIFKFPSYDEQIKIGYLFKQLDDIIAIHQQELDILQQTKQGFLQKMFPKDGESVPEIRFPGFSGNWQTKKLGEVGNTQSGVGFPEDEQGGEKGIPFYKVSDMTLPGNENTMNVSNNYVSQEQVKRKRWKVIDKVPTIIFAKVGAALMLNRKRLVTEKFLMDNNTMAYIFSENWDVNFGKAIFETINLPKYAQVGALPSFNGKDIESIKVLLPSLEEQVKVGNFFKQLDDTIALHEQELETLKQTKKAFLQKMFV